MATKLSNKTIDAIKQALHIAHVTKTGEILMDDFGLSGISEVNGILIVQPMDINFEFTALGIGRVAELRSRLNLVIDDPTLTAEFVEPELEPGTGNVYKLVFKTKKTKIEYRCAKASRIQTKKTLRDPVFFTFDLSQESARFMTSGHQTMSGDRVHFYSNEAGHAFLKFIDKEGDTLEHTVSTAINVTQEAEDAGEATFAHIYSVPKLAPLLRTSDSTAISITKRGAMKMEADGFTIYLLPEVDV